MMISFSGKEYLGMQRNPPHPTIEEELLKAFRASGAIDPDWFDRPQQAYFQRASRTDKGVSAIKMIISLRMAIEEDATGIVGSGIAKTIEKIQNHLPNNPRTIQINEIKRVTKNFNSKSACDARTYEYLLPTFAFQKAATLPPPLKDTSNIDENDDKNDINKQKRPFVDNQLIKELENEIWSKDEIESAFTLHENFRITPELVKRVNEVLQKFVGSHYYHNYTSGKLPLEPSALRYITAFEMGEPFIYSYKDDVSANISNAQGQLEFAVIKVKGQSFMLHQIRKMIGMSIAVVRGQASSETIDKSWESMRIDIPRAPGLGLMLDEIHYERYNKRFANDGIASHESLSWENVQDEVE